MAYIRKDGKIIYIRDGKHLPSANADNRKEAKTPKKSKK